MYSAAKFKRDAASGNMSLELVERYGQTGYAIDEKLRGIRKVVKANTVEAVLVNKMGQESTLRFDCASLMEYNGDTVTFYAPAHRELTEREREILAEHKQLQDSFYERCPNGSYYWQMKHYFAATEYPWLSGDDIVRGKKYLSWENKVLDKSIKGNVILKYNVYMEV